VSLAVTPKLPAGTVRGVAGSSSHTAAYAHARHACCLGKTRHLGRPLYSPWPSLFLSPTSFTARSLKLDCVVQVAVRVEHVFLHKFACARVSYQMH